MSTNNVKRATMRQQLRVKAESELGDLKKEALRLVGKLAKAAGVERDELVKAISVGSHKTADHLLVTDLANRYEAEIVELWNNQQSLALGEKK